MTTGRRDWFASSGRHATAKSVELGRRVKVPTVADEVVVHVTRLHRPNRRTGGRRSLREIADELSKFGVNGRSGKPYHAGSIRHMLEK
jgi:hypothetical protein